MNQFRRFVFVMASAEEVVNGSLRELRACNADEAEALMAGTWLVSPEGGATAKLVGERIGGLGRMQRFMPLVPLTEVPDEIMRNERVVGVDARKEVA